MGTGLRLESADGYIDVEKAISPDELPAAQHEERNFWRNAESNGSADGAETAIYVKERRGSAVCSV